MVQSPPWEWVQSSRMRACLSDSCYQGSGCPEGFTCKELSPLLPRDETVSQIKSESTTSQE